MRKDDDLSRLTGFSQPFSDLVAMQMIERRDGIIENDRRLRVDRRQLSEESCSATQRCSPSLRTLPTGSLGLLINRTSKKGTPAVVFAC